MGSASSSQIPGRKSSSAVSKVSGLRWLAYGLAQAGASPLARSFRVLNFSRSPLYKMVGFPHGRLPSAGDVFPGFFLIRESNARTQHLCRRVGKRRALRSLLSAHRRHVRPIGQHRGLNRGYMRAPSARKDSRTYLSTRRRS